MLPLSRQAVIVKNTSQERLEEKVLDIYLIVLRQKNEQLKVDR